MIGKIPVSLIVHERLQIQTFFLQYCLTHQQGLLAAESSPVWDHWATKSQNLT